MTLTKKDYLIISFTISPDRLNQLDELANETQRSRSVILQNIVDYGLENKHRIKNVT